MMESGTVVSDPLIMWVIYEKPSDYPNCFVLRPNLIEADRVIPLSRCFLAPSLEEIREYVPVGLYRLPRDENYDPVIVETWL